jgi:outer membrane cobalamin receptor
VTSASSDPLLAEGRELRRRPRRQGSVTAEVTLSRATLAATLVGVGKRSDSDFLGIGLVENPGFKRLDVRAAYQVSAHARVQAALENASNAEYQEVLGFAALPRRFRISLAFDSVR